MVSLLLQSFGGGLLGSVAQVAVLAGTLVLLLALVGFGAFAYKQLRGDGVEWPDETPEEEDGVQAGDADDEWDYY
jgi:hypothetical protein